MSHQYRGEGFRGELTPLVRVEYPRQVPAQRLLQCINAEVGFQCVGQPPRQQLAEVTVFCSVPAVERDLYWEPQTLGEIRRQSR